jgi:hypothetical protein
MRHLIESLEEASIAKMNRRAKAGSKSAPSANQKPYNSLSSQEKKVVDRQVAADAKGFMDGYGKVERTTDGPMLVVDANPIKEYVQVDGMESSYEDNAGYTITVPDDFAIGTFKVILQPHLVGFNKVKYEVTYYESMGSNEAEDPSPFRDDIRLDDIAKGAESAIAKGGLPAFERLIKEKVPSVREILAAFDEHLQDNAGDY